MGKMIKRHLPVLALVLLLVVSASGCCDCPRRSVIAPAASQVPVPSAYRLNTQQTMQAVHHWKTLAHDVAEQIKNRIAYESADFTDPVFVVPSGVTPFEKAFRELLITALVENAFLISKDASNSLLLDVDIQLVRHDRSIQKTSSGVYSSLGPGVFVREDIDLFGPDNQIDKIENDIMNSRINVEAGMFSQDIPETEILITTSLSRNDVFVMRKSYIYYISESEWRHYRKTPAGVLKKGIDTTYTIVSE